MLDAIEARIAAGHKVAPGACVVTVSGYAKIWISDRRNLDLADVDNDDARLRNHVLPHPGTSPIAKVRPRHLIDMATAWRTSGAVAPKTIYNIYSTLKALFRDAMIADLIESSPCVLTKYHLGENVDTNPER